MLAGAHEKFEHTEIYLLLGLNIQYKPKLKLRLDMVSKKVTKTHVTVLSRFSTSEYFRAKRLFPFVLELSAGTKWN